MYRIIDIKRLLSYMNTSILSTLDSLPYFTIEAVKQIYGDGSVAAGTIQTALYRWMKAGHVIQLKKGVYMTRRFYDLHRADADFSMAVSAILIPRSYVSLEFILQRNAVLTQVTYPISAITLKNTRVIGNSLGTFTYHHIKEELYRGFSMSDYQGVPLAQASVAKALFDYLYLRPWTGGTRSSAYNLAEELRLNLDDLTKADQDEFATYVESIKSLKMNCVLKNLRRTIWRP
jgi:predicted transcriptional regulator of viral defense system